MKLFIEVLKGLAIFIFGIIIPVLLIYNAHNNMQNLKIDDPVNRNPVVVFLQGKKTISSNNDYYLFSLLYTESANQKSLFNKQLMKISIMQIGFSIMSLGIMFVLLGFNDGGAEITSGSKGAGIDLSFRSTSTGIIIFTIGATMAATAGISKNSYSTVPIPSYSNQNNQNLTKSIAVYKQCKVFETNKFRECFTKSFYEINKEELK